MKRKKLKNILLKKEKKEMKVKQEEEVVVVDKVLAEELDHKILNTKNNKVVNKEKKLTNQDIMMIIQSMLEI